MAALTKIEGFSDSGFMDYDQRSKASVHIANDPEHPPQPHNTSAEMPLACPLAISAKNLRHSPELDYQNRNPHWRRVLFFSLSDSQFNPIS